MGHRTLKRRFCLFFSRKALVGAFAGAPYTAPARSQNLAAQQASTDYNLVKSIHVLLGVNFGEIGLHHVVSRKY